MAPSSDNERDHGDRVKERERDREEENGSKEKEVAEGGRRQRKRKSLWDTAAPEDAAKKPAIGGDASLGSGDISSAALAAALQQQQILANIQVTNPTLPGKNEACRIYVGSIFYDLTEADIILAFSPFGPITKIDMPKDATTGRHKGFCFIEFMTPEAAQTALNTMNDFPLGGRRLKVGRPNHVGSGPHTTVVSPFSPNPVVAAAAVAASNPAAASNPLIAAQLAVAAATGTPGMSPLLSAFGQTSTGAGTANPKQIYVGSVVYDISEKDIMAIFSAFGTIKSCQLIPNPETGKHKGYGFIEYANEDSAKAALQCMNGFQLAGRQLKVGWAVASSATTSSLQTPPPSTSYLQHQQALVMASILNNSPSANIASAAPFSLPGAAAATSPTASTTSALLLQQQMAAAQQALASSAAGAVKEESLSRCVVLNNMVSADEVDDELQSEVTDECGKFGKVEKVVIYKEQQSDNPDDAVVKIFVQFAQISDAESAVSGLNKRWFGGRQVNANFYDEGRFASEDFSG